MPGPNPKPAAERRTRHVPQRGEYQTTPAIGWQHGETPKLPSGLLAASKEAWRVWFGAWFAAHWTPDDLPGLRKVILLYDATERGELHRSAELRQMLDNYGVTPKGQQDRRWVRPKPEDVPAAGQEPSSDDPYGHLRVVS